MALPGEKPLGVKKDTNIEYSEFFGTLLWLNSHCLDLDYRLVSA